MRRFIIGMLLIVSLSACNMTTAHQSDEVQTLATPLPTLTAMPPFVTQAIATQMPTSAPSQQNAVVPQQNTVAQQNNVAAQQNAVACTPINDGWQTYTVVAGDTLSEIARQVSITTERLAQANCLQDANSLTVGQTLLVPVKPNLVSVPDVGRLRIVGDFAGMHVEDLQSCWAQGKGGNSSLVYDVINGTPIAVLSNRVPVVAAQSTEWVQVYLNGTKTIPEMTGWMNTADITLAGACTEATGIQFDTWRGPVFGNPAGVPDGTCAVAPLDPTNKVTIYVDPNINGQQIGTMNGWGLWVSTQGQYYQVQLENIDAGGATFLAWVETARTQKVNC